MVMKALVCGRSSTQKELDTKELDTKGGPTLHNRRTQGCAHHTMSVITTTEINRHKAERIGSNDCWHLLAQGHEGRLGYLSGHGSVASVVTYTVAPEGVAISLPDFNAASQYVPGRDVTFEVSGCDDSDHLWVVNLRGRARRVSDLHAERAGVSAHLEHWPSVVLSSYIFIAATGLDGSWSAPQDQR